MAITTKENLAEFNMAQQKLIAIASMKRGGWKADLPLIEVKPMLGVDSVCGDEFWKSLNTDLDNAMTKINRKVLKQVKKVELDAIKAMETVDGVKEEMFKRYPTIDPDYSETDVPEAK